MKQKHSPNMAKVHPLAWLGAISTGVLSALAMPGHMEGWLIWISPIGLLLALQWGIQAPISGEKTAATVKIRGKKRRSYFLGLLTGVIHFLISLRWLKDMSIPSAPDNQYTLALIAWIALSLYLANYTAVFALIVASCHRLKIHHLIHLTRQSPRSVQTPNINQPVDHNFAMSKDNWWNPPLRNTANAAFIALTWVATETIRNHFLGGFNWNGSYSAFYDQPVFAQAADISGVMALSFLPWFSGALIIGMISRIILRQRRKLGPRPQLDLLILVSLFALIIIYSAPYLTVRQDPNTRLIKSLAIQPMTSIQDSNDPSKSEQIHRKHLQLIQTGLRNSEETELSELIAQFKKNGTAEATPGRIDFILLPESSVSPALLQFGDSIPMSYNGIGSDGEQREIQQTALARFEDLLHLHSSIVVGSGLIHYPDTAQLEERNIYNTLFAISNQDSVSRSSAVQSQYRKRHLVPFGETLPFRSVLPFLHDLLPSNFTSGEPNQRFPVKAAPPSTGEIRTIPLICFEDTVPRVARNAMNHNPSAQLIINATNDGWFPELCAIQHLEHAKFRSIELRRPMLRASNTGGTAAINNRGLFRDPVNSDRSQLLQFGDESLEGSGALYSRLSIHTDTSHISPTLYLRWGNWVAIVSVVSTIIAVIVSLARQFKKTNK